MERDINFLKYVFQQVQLLSNILDVCREISNAFAGSTFEVLSDFGQFSQVRLKWFVEF